MRWRLLGFSLVVAAAMVSDVAAAETDNFFTELDMPETAAVAAGQPAKRVDVDRLDPIQTGSVGPRSEQSPTDLLPSKTSIAPTAAETTGVAAPKPQPTAKSAEKGIDPEPDVAIKPVAVPSHDPLDALTPTSDPKSPMPIDGTREGAKDIQPTGREIAIKAALDKRDAISIKGANGAERRKEREAVAVLYAAHGFGPVWSDAGVPVAAVAPVLERLARADDDALTLMSVPKKLDTAGSADAIAESDVALTEAVVAYARQASGARVDPHGISPLIGVKPALADPAEVVDVIASAGANAGDRLQALNPIDPRYVALRDKRMALRTAHPVAGGTSIASGPSLRIGMRDPRVPSVRARLGIDAFTLDAEDGLTYDSEIADAVADFQRANGLTPSGVLSKRTVEAMSGSHPSRIETTIAANMEMWRWMPRDLGANRIEVNVPEFTVTVFRDGAPADKHRVVVGKTDTPTPLFSNTMKFLIVNPVWNVPDSIIKKEFLPKSGDDPDYIAHHGFDVSYDHGRLVVKQPSGAKNALGQIKFMFPNDYSVYLHDTPSKSLFSASKRAFSHGCVRVDQPFGLADSVLNDAIPDGGKQVWSEKRLRAMIGDKERYVYLPTPLPIHIEYFTATVDPDDGQVKMHDDIYGYANLVAAALGLDSDPTRVADHKAKLVADRKKSTTVAGDPFDPR